MLFHKKGKLLTQQNMTTVSTKQELVSAIERRETQIIATDEIAASIRRKVIVNSIQGLILTKPFNQPEDPPHSSGVGPF